MEFKYISLTYLMLQLGIGSAQPLARWEFQILESENSSFQPELVQLIMHKHLLDGSACDYSRYQKTTRAESAALDFWTEVGSLPDDLAEHDRLNLQLVYIAWDCHWLRYWYSTILPSLELLSNKIGWSSKKGYISSNMTSLNQTYWAPQAPL